MGICRSDPDVFWSRFLAGEGVLSISSDGQDSNTIATTRPGPSEIVLPSNQQETCIFQSRTLLVTDRLAKVAM